MIDRGVGATGNGRQVVDGLNDTDKRFILMLVKTVQLPGTEDYD